MNVIVKHFKERLAERVSDLKTLSGYQTVAIVPFYGDSIDTALESAFKATNNIGGSWSMNPQEWESVAGKIPNPDYDPKITRVANLPNTPGGLRGLRSSSVGDLFEINGVDYVVMGMGFKPLLEVIELNDDAFLL